jgi:hypothetical protein
MTTSELLTAITAELSAIGAATDLGIISQEGERVSTVLMIDERRFCLTIEPAPVDMLPDLQLEIADIQSSSSLIHQTEVDSR